MLVTFLCSLLAGAGLWAQGDVAGPPAEGKKAEPGAVTFSGAYYGEDDPVEVPSSRSMAEGEEDEGKLYNINMVVVVGDRDEVYGLANWEHYENEALYEPMSEADIEAFRQTILKDLQDGGYIFSTVSVYKPSLVQGFLKLRVHVGELGLVTVKGNRYRSAEQILRKIDWQTGREFDYRAAYRKLYESNADPRLNIDTQLKPRQEPGGRRVVDAEITVEEKFPLRVGLTLKNTGSDASHDWRANLTLQYFNLLKRDDVIGLEWSFMPESFSEVMALNTSYVLPINENWTFSAFGGVSESDLTDVLPGLDLVGKGYFFGFGVHRNLVDTEKSTLDLTVGWMFINSESRVGISGFSGEGDGEQRQSRFDMSIPRISLAFSAKDYDSWGGRNYFSNTLMMNFAGGIGSSAADNFKDDDVSGNFVINRFSAARFQKITQSTDQNGSLSLFARFDSQLASEAVPSAMQMALGGANSVRGYLEGEALGDIGYNASVELRTPLLANFIPGMKEDDEFLRDNPEYWGVHKLQGVVFYDVGAVKRLPGEKLDSSEAPGGGSDEVPGGDADSMASIGVGLRFMFTKYAQFRFDYGYPLLLTTDRTTSDGRIHFAGQFQF